MYGAGLWITASVGWKSLHDQWRRGDSHQWSSRHCLVVRVLILLQIGRYEDLRARESNDDLYYGGRAKEEKRMQLPCVR